MGTLKKVEVIQQISDYLSMGDFNDKELRRFRRDMRRMSLLSLEMILGTLRKRYL